MSKNTKIISVLNLKGGASKTTMATNLAVSLVARDATVCLVDTDAGQGSLMRWFGQREADDIHAVKYDEPRSLRKGVKHLVDEDRYDYIIIDGAPAVDRLATASIGISDLVIIPVGCSPYDVWATESMIDRIEEVKEERPDLIARYLITRHSKRTLVGQDIEEAIQKMETPMFRTTIATRIAYVDSAMSGMGVMEWDNTKAKDETRDFTDEVVELIGEI